MADEIDGTLYSLHSNMRRLREDGPSEGQNFADAAAKINKQISEAEQNVDPAIAKASRAAAYAGKRENNSKGGMPKKKTGPMQMAMGGMANGKKHMYLSKGALVTENLNPGLQALAKERPDVVRKILKK
tara:strand:+ start:685 stop:1071 length:387 start_codon:yes stop_codon:yes gene_type:complete